MPLSCRHPMHPEQHDLFSLGLHVPKIIYACSGSDRAERFSTEATDQIIGGQMRITLQHPKFLVTRNAADFDDVQTALK